MPVFVRLAAGDGGQLVEKGDVLILFEEQGGEEVLVKAGSHGHTTAWGSLWQQSHHLLLLLLSSQCLTGY